MIKALFFDIDDTLIARGHDTITPSAIKAINEAAGKGIKIIVATGRCYNIMHEDVKKSLPVDCYITINGGCVNEKNGEVSFSYPMSSEDVEKLINICLERDYPFAFKFSDCMLTYNRHDDFIYRYCRGPIKPQWVGNCDADRDYHLKCGMPIGCFIYSPACEALELEKDIEGLKFRVAHFESESCECFSKEINKGKTIRLVAEKMGISLKECAGFGDSTNDIEMMQVCGIGVAMGNALLETKQAADLVTDTVENDGIAKALKILKII